MSAAQAQYPTGQRPTWCRIGNKKLFQPNKAVSPGSQATCCLEAQSCWQPRRRLTLKLLKASGDEWPDTHAMPTRRRSYTYVASQASDT